MNSLIEILNEWGGRFLNFAWPMAWQASLLIVALLTFDFLFRRKVRASVRYALWLVVLVKLILPPALALPTSPAWWLHSNQPAILVQPQIQNYTVSYDSSPLPDASLKASTAFVPPKPVMTWAAWLLVLSVAVSVGLFVWLLVRWWQITRQVSRAKTSERLTSIVAQARSLAGVRGQPPVKLTANTMSPAVCGLFRPAILMPESLVEHFSEEQLRAVLLHELIHLRRRDVWLNFWQSLLQIVCWWHPLVWVANARIRQVREEAVDDAVMLALAGEAETYAPTLLEVAKLALNRPLASLGLVGILESRSALRERIERLVDFRAPRRAGLTLVSAFGVLTFSAVAVPMGGAPGLDEPAASPAAVVAVATNKTDVRLPQVYIQADFYRMRDGDLGQMVADLKYKSAEKGVGAWWSAAPEKLSQLNQKLKLSGLQPFASPRIQTTSGSPTEFYVGNGTNSVEVDCRPFVADGFIFLNRDSKMIVRIATTAMTNRFGNHVEIENHGCIMVSMKDQNDVSGSNVVVVINTQILTNHYGQRLEGIINRVQPSTNTLSAGDVVVASSSVTNAMSSHFNQRLKGIVNRADSSTNATVADGQKRLFSEIFRVDSRSLAIALRKQTGLPVNNATDIAIAARSYFTKSGMDWESPKGKTVFYNDRQGLLFVKATQRDLEFVEDFVLPIGQISPQIHIKARFIEMPKGTLAGMKKSMVITNQPSPTNGMIGILTSENFKTTLQSLERLPGVEELAEPEVTTLSGREAQMRVTELIGVVTNFALMKNPTNGVDAVVPQTGKFETGTILDAKSYVLADEHRLYLTLTPSFTEFLGYDTPPRQHFSSSDTSIHLPLILPHFRVRETTVSTVLGDNQTIVLSGFPEIDYIGDKKSLEKSKPGNKELVVLITATILDESGNRVNSDEALAATQN